MSERQHEGGSRGRWARCALGLLLVALLAGCEDSPNSTLLKAPGGRGTITGTVTFSGAGGPPYPVAEVLAFQNADPNCRSDFGGIALLGNFNNFAVAEARNYLLTEVAPCLWVREQELPKGVLDFKFVTGTSALTIAFDSPPDYGKGGANTGGDPLDGTLDTPANGPDGNLSVTLPEAGVWTFILNETTTPATYRIIRESLFVRTDPEDPTFRISSLPVGVYDVTVNSSGFFGRRYTEVSVEHNQVTDLSPVVIELIAGAIKGRVRFSDDPSPLPTATVTVSPAGTAQILATAQTESTFALGGLTTGLYDLKIDARGYRDTTLAALSYMNGANTDVGDVVLESEAVIAITMDGSADVLYGNARTVQAVQTGFGDSNQGQVGLANGSELDQAFAILSGNVLYVLIAGNLESNNNKLEVFIDSKAGGQGTLRTDNANIDFDGLNRMSGLIFDTGFEADYYLSMSGSVGGGGYQVFANWAELLTAGAGLGRYLGQGTAASDGALTGGENPDGILVTINNSNSAGVGGGSAAASGAGVFTGIEWAIPLAAIGNPTGCVKVTAFVNGINHDYLANQVLGPLTPPQDNLGDPHSVNFQTLAGAQYFEVCAGAPPVRFPGPSPARHRRN